MSAPMGEAVIDLDAYRDNLAILASHAPDAALMAVVKADAYGHGARRCARAARNGGATWLGVATLEEAHDLRDGGDEGPLLAWLAPVGADFAAAVDRGIDVAAGSAEQLAEIVACGSRDRPRVHLKVDTGMSRNGVAGEDLERLLAEAATAQRHGRVEVVGIFSHLACADQPSHPSLPAQERRLADAVSALDEAGVRPELRHLANSAATLTRPSSHLDLVRVGIATYGLTPAPDVGSSHDFGLRPVMTLRSHLVLVKQIPAGAGVSYGHTYVAAHDTTVGLVPLGYGDGILRCLSDRGPVWVAGRRHRFAGRVCMDQVVVDLEGRRIERGAPVVLFGTGEDGEPTAQDWAEEAGTISYEVVTRLGPRVRRTYTGER